MTDEIPFDEIPKGLHFYWYEFIPSDEHAVWWGQLCGCLHRLAFVRNGLLAIREISDLDEALYGLEYHMENYLVRVYELRERASNLLKTFAGDGDIKKLKNKDTREVEVSRILPDKPEVKILYHRLLSLLDDDIKLRNTNTHQNFLTLGLSDGYNIFEVHDLLGDLEGSELETKERILGILKEAIEQKICESETKIDQVLQITTQLLDCLDFKR